MVVTMYKQEFEVMAMFLELYNQGPQAVIDYLSEIADRSGSQLRMAEAVEEFSASLEKPN